MTPGPLNGAPSLPPATGELYDRAYAYIRENY